MDLKDLGWEGYKTFLDKPEKFSDNFIARVLSENKTNYNLLTLKGEEIGVLRGKTLYSLEQGSLPKVGDWVVFSKNSENSLLAIESVLPRKTKLSRQVSGENTKEQIIVTNIDTVFIIQGLDSDFNLNRLERYLIMVNKSGAKPIIILNKADLVTDTSIYIKKVKKITNKTPIVVMSAEKNDGIENIYEYLSPQKTAVFVGSSGVGKSTLLNRLLESDIQETQPLRNDDKGRHTTTRREIFILPSGSIVIDTPGMREIGLMSSDETEDTFQDMEELALKCKYRKCDHIQTEGCAILEAVKNNKISQERVDNYIKLKNEINFEKNKLNKEKNSERKKRTKKTTKNNKKHLVNKKY